MPADCTLLPMTRDDLPLLAEWLSTAHARQWWGDPVEQLELVSEDLAEPLLDQQIASLDDAPFGYLQSYPVHAWPEGAPHLADFPAGSAAVDCFIGPLAMLGQGHGATMLRLYAQHLLKSAPAVVIDPDPDNERAVRAYRRAGFRDVAFRRDGAGDMTLVMRFDPDRV